MFALRGKLADRVVNIISGFVLNLLCVIIEGVFVKSCLHVFLEYLKQYRRKDSHYGQNAINSIYETSIRLDNKLITRF
jgi:hypothetical protein